MRTIKFRGKSIVTGEWLFGNLFQFGIQPPANVPCICTCVPTWKDAIDIYNVDENTIGQFTGLYDKNGEEIYEGDVVKFVNPKYGDELFRIGYEDSHIGAFCLCEAGEEDTSRFVAIFGRFDYEPFYCEVIGNIHDNPDLMKGGEE